MSSYDPFDITKKQVDDLRRWADRHRGRLIGGAIAALVALVFWTCYYQVEAEEQGVVLRFGKHVETTEPGPHFKLPLGIDQVVVVPVARQLRLEFGFRTARAGVQSEFTRNRRTMAEARMLTADLNIGTVEWIVQYIVDTPEKFLFRFRDIETTLRLMSEAIMRSVVGDYTIDELITGGRADIEAAAQTRLKALNKIYDTGVIIQHVKLKKVDVPEPVKPALSEVEEAKQQKSRLINEADEQRKKVIPEARGKAEQAISAARGYATERVNEAEGDANRFKKLYAEYRKAPDITRTRLYFESMSKTLTRAKRKVLVDEKAKGVLPLLNLNGGAGP